MKKCNLIVLLLVYYAIATAQIIVPKKSIHQEESEYYKSANKSGEYYQQHYQSPFSNARTQTSTSSCSLTKKVYGWHPYWQNGAEANYQWNKLSHLVFFDYEIDPSTGNNTNNSFNWSTANAVTQALANNVKVHFCATLFSNHATFLNSTTAKQAFITNAISLLQARGGTGVNIDFEMMSVSNKTLFANFIVQLSTALKAANPNYELTLALPAVDYSSVMDIVAMNAAVDLFVIMGYDYYYSGSANAGPTSPTYSLTTSYNYNLSRSMTYFLNQGVSKNKLLCALPFYGREWNVSGTTAGATTTGGSASVKYNAFRINANGYFSNRLWEPNCLSPYYNYNGKQCFIDDAYSFEKKLNLVDQMGLAGIGIWALGYDDGYTDLWDKIEKKFTTCRIVNCTDTIYDGGGPTRDYYANENYTYTIAPTGASSVTVNFMSFALENGYDSLFLYDGASVAAPLIGKYTGTVGPGSKTSSSGAITMKFKADNGLNNTGFVATYSCQSDNFKPSTAIATTGYWQTQNFSASFNDTDIGSGVDQKFYNVADYNRTAWSSNRNNGFLCDEFNAGLALNNWQSVSGTWSISSNQLVQTDDAQNNTNLYTTLNQNDEQAYIYHWKMSIAGNGTNRRAGIHIACSMPDSANRGTSYFVWFRLDNNKIQVYKTLNNNLGSIAQEVPYTFSVGTLYDIKVLYDKAGVIKIFMNDNLITIWNDPGTPITTGNYLSIRTGNASVIIDDFKVYKSRSNSAVITIGNATSDIRYQNFSPTAPSARVTSLITDLANNISTATVKNINIDWTKPSSPFILKDGIAGADIDSTTNTTLLAANWSFGIDSNSLVVNNYYAVGTQPFTSDIVDWTNNTNRINFNINTITLQTGKMYYTSVVVQNGAGLYSDTVVTNGFKLADNTSLIAINDKNIRIQPNPVKDVLLITTDYKVHKIALVNLLGQEVVIEKVVNYNTTLTFSVADLQAGMYELLIYHTNGIATSKIVKD